MCTGFIEIALILLPIGFIGRPYHNLAEDTLMRGQRVTGIMLLLGLYIITNLLLLGGDEVGRRARAHTCAAHAGQPAAGCSQPLLRPAACVGRMTVASSRTRGAATPVDGCLITPHSDVPWQVACQMEDPFLVLPLADRTEGVVDLIRRCARGAAPQPCPGSKQAATSGAPPARHSYLLKPTHLV